MSKRKTVTMKTLASPLVLKVIDEQCGNLTQRHFQKTGPYRQVHKMLSIVARRAIYCALIKPAAGPHFCKNWHKDFANAVEQRMIDAGFEACVPRFIQDFKNRFPKVIGNRAETEWSYYKIATYAGQCATMIAYGYNPTLLTAHEEEVN